MIHGRLFSTPNYPENSCMCLLFVCEVEKIALNWLFEVPRAYLVGTYGALLAYFAIFAADIYLSH